jgi:HD-like signal output (HDOD) protein/CheY-like chemotaxis protein
VSTRRILFVDDEANVLDGLQNLLRKQRRQWEMVFVLGGQAALTELEKQPFDVIVSDMRMPEMDGATLLQKVMEKYPRMTRIALSGQAEMETLMRALPVAQQFLSKPCDAQVLRGVIERACELQTILSDDNIRAIVGRVEKLPSIPRTYWELMGLVARSDVAVADIARIVEQDPAMTAKVLQLVNSAYFGLAQQMKAVGPAVNYLGLDLIKALALSAHVFAAMETASPVEGFSLETFQQRSLVVARVAKRLMTDPKHADEAFTVGIVHDIGQIVLALGVPDRFREALRVFHRGGGPLHVAEQAVIGVTHAQVGAYLLGSWGLPFRIVDAVAYHHNPGRCAPGGFDVLAALHVADAIVPDHGEDPCQEPPDGVDGTRLDMPFLETLGVTAKIDTWRAVALEETRTPRDV